MSFVNRTYPSLVRDLLTTLTQGVTGETHRIDYEPDAQPVTVPDVVLQRRPVARVSSVEGFIAAAQPDDPPEPYAFTLNDYELVADGRDPTALSTIRFLPFGRKPAPNTTIRVNYYPRTTEPVPVNDVAAGSVVRTLIEVLSKELAVVYQQLNLAYDSAFLETATGLSLDRVVALLGYRRFLAGRAVGKAVFTRRSGATGEIVIPASTPITDTADKVRYETVETRVMLAGETTAEIAIRGATVSAPTVEANTLTVIQRSIAGIDAVANAAPTARATADESDDELRARARDALMASNKGTVAALRNGLLQLPDVKDVAVVEMPNGVPGEIRLTISLAPNVAIRAGQTLPDNVLNRIEELRPAGIRILKDKAGETALAARVRLVLAGAPVPQGDVDTIFASVKKILIATVNERGVGDRLRAGRLVAALLADTRIADAVVAVGAKDGPAPLPGSDFVPADDTTLTLADADIVFDEPAFEESSAPAAVTVSVRGRFKLALLAGTTQADAQNLLRIKLNQFLTALPPGARIDTASLLTGLRDDGHYGIDPLGLSVTLSLGQEIFTISEGGPSFEVKASQSFTVIGVEAVI
jgi:hypothetical protein